MTVHKPGEDPTDPLGYRGINLLNAISKVCDKEMFNQMVEYLEENKLIPENTHGSRKRHSTTTAAASILRNINTIKDKKIPAADIAIDKNSAYCSL